MKKFCVIMIISLCLFSAKAFAADIWFLTEYDKDGNKIEQYIDSDSVVENLNQKFFSVDVKSVINGRIDSVRSHTFYNVVEKWYAKYSDTEDDLIFINRNEFYKKAFDACKRYSSLTRVHPR